MAKKSKTKKSKRKIKWLKLFFLLFAPFFIIHVLYLDRQVTTKFESRKWNLPSRIYSDSTELYPGKIITDDELQDRLLHLGYTKTDSTPHEPGRFQISEKTYSIFLHRFEYPDQAIEAYPIELTLENNRIKTLINKNTGEDLKLSRLEPELIASVFDAHFEDRTFVSLTNIPKVFIQSVLLAEDRHFYEHFGIDPLGILRAFGNNIIKGRIVQGGSTLTQQLAKNFFLHEKRTLSRKFNEAIMAVLIEWHYSKDEILESYLNEIYFGQRGAASITGVEEAAKFYFSKSISNINPAEAAQLAIMIRSPGLYSPALRPDKVLKKRNELLEKLKDYPEVYNPNEHAKWIATPVSKQNKIASEDVIAPHFVEFVKKQIKENFSQNILESEGMRLFTTLDMYLQRAAHKATQSWLTQLEKNNATIKKKSESDQKLEIAFVALNPQTGYVLAYIGGRDYGTNQFDHVSDAFRQPGSSFKPFVYLTALLNGIEETPVTLATLLEDKPHSIKTATGLWTPENYDKKYNGNVRLRVALETSLNAATVWLASKVGYEKIVSTAKKAGFSMDLKPYPSLALGAMEVTPLELAAAYTVFPNGGLRSRPLSIRRVLTKEGQMLEKKSFEMEEVFPPAPIYLMNRLMMGVLDHGTATGARSRGFLKLAAGKTGTTSDYRDSWFAGYTPDLVAIAWLGYDNNDVTKLSGASGALPVWTEFMKTATAGKTYVDFAPAAGIITVKIDTDTGLLYDHSCSGEFDEYFLENTQPDQSCTLSP